MNWRLGGFISERLAGVLIPVCVFGLLASLILHLIDLRSAFIPGGETKLRQATLAFAAAVILLERLTYLEGPTVARAYKWAVGITITLFAVYYTAKFRLPAPFVIVFALTESLFALLWWAGHAISEACSVNDEKVVEEAAESGILRAVKLRLGRRPAASAPAAARAAATWGEKLAFRHPGRVLLYFSLVAIPLFGLGLLVFRADDPARIRLGMWLFLCLWCGFTLLLLSSLRLLIAYFHKREVSLPDLVGLTWVALGFVLVGFALPLAFLLPQPPSAQSAYVRHQIFASYRGWEASHGFKDGRPLKTDEDQDKPTKPGKQSLEDWSKEIKDKKEREARDIDRLDKGKDPYLSTLQRSSGIAPEAENLTNLITKSYDGMRAIFAAVLKAIAVLVGLGALFLIGVVAVSVFKYVREGAILAAGKTAGLRKLIVRGGKKPASAALGLRRFAAFGDPFLDPARHRDPGALVHYLWEALLAWCADAGTPCSPDQTPLEFVDGRPAALQGFETRALFIAKLFTFSEFSSQPVPDATVPELQQFWLDLQRHTRG